MPAGRRKLDDRGASRIFAALGESTRLRLVRRLAERSPLSVGQLREGLPVTRQGVEKHLRVLVKAGVAADRKRGRERLYSLEVDAVRQAQHLLDGISAGWDRALARLKDLVEEDAP